MAIGVLAPSPGSLDPNGAQQLQDATLPVPTADPAWSKVGLAFDGSFGSLADPRPDAFDKDGNWEPEHDLVYHNRIHVIPRNRDVGFVVSEQDYEVEVWNAFLTRAKTLDEITLEGPAGVEIIDHLGQPAHYPASQSEIYTYKVLAEGAPNIDNVITWVFLTIASSGTDHRIVGFRIIPFPFPANWAYPVVETWGYMTDVMTAFRGMEQRVQLRAVPIGTIAFSTVLNVPRDAQMAIAILFGNQPRAFGVPRWQFQRPLVSDANPDDTEIFIDTTHIPFQPGGLVFLWTDPYTWEALPIASVLSDRIVLDVELENAWVAGVTVVLPMVVGRLSPDEAVTWENLLIASTALTFDIDGFKP
jgi:hypothetical protein